MGEYSKSSKLERSRHTILQKILNKFLRTNLESLKHYKSKEKVWMKNRCSSALKIPIWSWLLSWMPNWTGRDYFWKSWRHGWRFSMMSPSTLKSSNSCQYWNFLKDGNLGIFFCLIYQKHGTGERKIGLDGICTGKKYANF